MPRLNPPNPFNPPSHHNHHNRQTQHLPSACCTPLCLLACRGAPSCGRALHLARHCGWQAGRLARSRLLRRGGGSRQHRGAAVIAGRIMLRLLGSSPAFAPLHLISPLPVLPPVLCQSCSTWHLLTCSLPCLALLDVQPFCLAQSLAACPFHSSSNLVASKLPLFLSSLPPACSALRAGPHRTCTLPCPGEQQAASPVTAQHAQQHNWHSCAGRAVDHRTLGQGCSRVWSARTRSVVAGKLHEGTGGVARA